MRTPVLLAILFLLASCGGPPADSVAVDDVAGLVSFYETYDCGPGGADAALFTKHRQRLVDSGKYKTGTISLPVESTEEEMWSHAKKVFNQEAFRRALLTWDAKTKSVTYLMPDVLKEKELKSAMDLLKTKY